MSVINDNPIVEKVVTYFKEFYSLSADVILVHHPIKGYTINVWFNKDGVDSTTNYCGSDHVPTMKKMDKWLTKTGESING
jgi:hypothetical protein